jgi:hypothetical protein
MLKINILDKKEIKRNKNTCFIVKYILLLLLFFMNIF